MYGEVDLKPALPRVLTAYWSPPPVFPLDA